MNNVVSSGLKSLSAKSGLSNLQRVFAVGTLALVTLAVPTRATLISVDRLAIGDGQLTRDTASGLDWLDLTLTTNRSQASATGLTASGGQFEGFRLATVGEFQTLLSNAGLAPNNGPSADPLQVAAGYQLQNLLGLTNTYLFGPRGLINDSNGWLAGVYNIDFNNANAGFLSTGQYHPTQGTAFVIGSAGGGPGDARPDYGLFLVRNTPAPNTSGVPESGSSVAMLGAVFLGLALMRRFAGA